jgi:hypothetical protein
MPARSRDHPDRKINFAAGRRGPFGDELRLDPPRLSDGGNKQEG